MSTTANLTSTAYEYVAVRDNRLVNTLGGTSGFGDDYLYRNDDGYTSRIDITSVFGPEGLSLFGKRYTWLYVNNNGNLTFDNGLSSYTPGQITAGSSPIIAAFWADVDTRGGTVAATSGGYSTGSNLAWYDLDAENRVFTATWDDVGYYSSATDKLNAFQIQLVARGNTGDFDIIYRYETVNWTTGSASGGSYGLGGTVARAGYSAGDGNSAHYYELPQSGNQAEILALDETAGNTGRTGTWVFEVRNGDVVVIPTTNQPLVLAAANLAARAYSDAHYGTGSASDTVNANVASWAALSGTDFFNQSELALFNDRFGRGQLTVDEHVLRFDHLEASASVGITILNGQRTLGVSFEGTNFGLINEDPIQRRDLWDDLVNIDRHYNLLSDFMSKVAAYANNPSNRIEKVLVSGHSLGGALAQEFMSAYGVSDQRYIGYTFGSPGSIDHANLPSSRMINFAHTEDLVPILGQHGMGVYQSVNRAIDLASQIKSAIEVIAAAATGGVAGAAAYAIESLIDSLAGKAIDAAAKTAIMDWLNGGLDGNTANDPNLQASDRMTFEKVSDGLNKGLSRVDYTVSGAKIGVGIDYAEDSWIPGMAEHSMIFSSVDGYDVTYRASIDTMLDVLDESAFIQNLRVLRGTSGNDDLDPSRLINGDFALVLGGDGNDTIDGTIGKDVLCGGSGDDVLDAGMGNDTYLFTREGNGTDTIDLEWGDSIRVIGGNFAGKVGTGDGTGILANQVQLSAARNTIYIGTDNTPGADITIQLSDPLSKFVAVRGTGTDIKTLLSYGGRCSDGYIAGATIYIDANGNGKPDVNENTGVITDASGNFTLESELQGSIIAVGGINIDTGLPNTMAISGPGDGSIFNPLTTLINKLDNEGNLDPVSAEAAVQSAFGIAGDIDLVNFDPLAVVDDTSVAVQRTAVQLAVMASLTKDGGLAMSKVAGAIGGSGNAVDLTDASGILSILGTGVTLDTASRIARINGNIQEAQDFDGIADVQKHALDVINDTPTLKHSTQDITVQPGEQLSFSLADQAFFDADGTMLTYKASLVDGSALPPWLLFNSAQLSFSGKAGTTAGSIAIKVTATDPGMAEAFDYIRINIAPQLSNGEPGDTHGATGVSYHAGGAGDDIYTIDQSGDAAVEALDEGNDRVDSTVNYALGDNIEALTLLGITAQLAIGNELDNTLIGNSAANRLYGGLGADAMQGMGGSDVYFVDNAGDTVTEIDAAGIDEVFSSVSFALGSHIEKLTLTGSDPINGTGNTLANTITGNDADNVIDGGGAIDSLKGGKGDDTYIVDFVKTATGTIVREDVVTEIAGQGSDTLVVRLAESLAVPAGFTVTLDPTLENLTLLGNANLNGKGNLVNNRIVGNDGNNILDGAAGIDTLEGGAGNDTYVVDSAAELAFLVEQVDGGIDTLQLMFNLDAKNPALDISLSEGLAGIEHLRINGTGRFNLFGNDAGNSLTGNAVANILDGGSGADTLIGGTGNDTYVVDDIADIIVETSTLATEIDTVESSISQILGNNLENLFLTGSSAIAGTGNALANFIVGNAAANTLTGGLGNDTLDGGLNNDVMAGGDGNDTYVVDSAGDTISEEKAGSSGGIDTVRSNITWTLGADIENLQLTGTANINGTGNALANLIEGNDQDNALDGGLGADTLKGGKGNDSYRVRIDQSGTTVVLQDTVIEELNGGYDSITFESSIVSLSAASTITLAKNVENGTLASTGFLLLNVVGNDSSNTLIGNNAANRLDGGAGNDTLIGGAGADTLIGGVGNDRYVVDSSLDVVTESSVTPTEIDTVVSSIDFVLGANLENLELSGSAYKGTGNDLANKLVGNAYSNQLVGNGGADTLNGGEGSDTMTGGAGNDTYYVDNAYDSVVETSQLASEIDTVRCSVGWTLGGNLENLYLTGNSNINGIGNALGNRIVGNGGDNALQGLDGNDTLEGGMGVDSLYGGAGNDVYVISDSSDSIIEEGVGGGVDTVLSTLGFTLGNYLENLSLLGAAAINGTGNDLANLIEGNEGANLLDGAGGIDTLKGGKGDDSYRVDLVKSGSGVALHDTLLENLNEGNDTQLFRTSGDLVLGTAATLTLLANFEHASLADTGSNLLNLNGNILANRLTGNAAGNRIDGGAGDDTLIGGAGEDTLTGGIGADTYVVDTVGDVVTETSTLATEIDKVESTLATYTLTDNVEQLNLIGDGAISGIGNKLGNLISGNGLNNVLDGQDGNDTLIGGGGNDTLIGGNGSDTYFLENAGDVVQETGTGTGDVDTVRSWFSHTLDSTLENLVLAGTEAINGTGNAARNLIEGNDNANQLDGNSGLDTLKGGKGDDAYTVDIVTSSTTVFLEDTVIELAGQGNDSLVLRIAESLTLSTAFAAKLGDNLEILDATSTGTHALKLEGNALDNLLLGNAGNNRLDGGLGADTLIGDAGSDKLYGGLGNDTLTGGSGSDSFCFNSVLSASSNVDAVADFDLGTDKIQLELGIFGAFAGHNNQVLSDFGASLFTTVANIGVSHGAAKLLYEASTGSLYYDADGGGVGIAIKFATLISAPALTAGHIVFIDE